MGGGRWEREEIKQSKEEVTNRLLLHAVNMAQGGQDHEDVTFCSWVSNPDVSRDRSYFIFRAKQG
jgi:hypothetical protein